MFLLSGPFILQPGNCAQEKIMEMDKKIFSFLISSSGILSKNDLTQIVQISFC